jgi:cryptochrome
MFYILSVSVPNWDKDKGNSMCHTIPWGDDPELVNVWEEGLTGFPFIDALMRQLRQTGWMHHLGRHAVACFLTRGDLWQSWTKGRDVFDKYLLDADWALNNGNWLWLAGVAPFSSPYERIYDPCPGGKSSLNAEQSGEFVRHFVPELANMPAKYIYRPWTAPPAVQQRANCIIGKDYPFPIVDHKIAREANIERFGKALQDLKVKQLPAKFGNAKEDPGTMKSTYHTSTLFTPKASENQEAAIQMDSSQESNVDNVASAGYTPQPMRRWNLRRGSGK